MNLRCALPLASDPAPAEAEQAFDRLLDEKRQARIGHALIGASVVTGLCIIGWIIVALL